MAAYEFTQNEIELLANGFAFFVQDFDHKDDSPVHPLLERLSRFRDGAETSDLQQNDLIRAARQEVWNKVFDVVSAEGSFGARQLIKSLEAARDEDGCGPNSEATTS